MVTFRYKVLIAIIFTMILSLGILRIVPAAVSGQPLRNAMEATGAKVERFSVNAWVKLPRGKLSDAQLEDIVGQVMSQLGIISQEYQLIHQQEKGCKSVQAEVTRNNLHGLVIAQVVPGTMSILEPEGYLVVNIEANGEEYISISSMQERIARITNNFGRSPHINTCLIGWLDGKLGAGEWHKSLSDAFRVIDAIIIDKLEEQNYASYTGFTPEIAEALQVGGKKVNLNMAMRYSQYDHRTYVIIGSPIINREY